MIAFTPLAFIPTGDISSNLYFKAKPLFVVIKTSSKSFSDTLTSKSLSFSFMQVSGFEYLCTSNSSNLVRFTIPSLLNIVIYLLALKLFTLIDAIIFSSLLY